MMTWAWVKRCKSLRCLPPYFTNGVCAMICLWLPCSLLFAPRRHSHFAFFLVPPPPPFLAATSHPRRTV